MRMEGGGVEYSSTFIVSGKAFPAFGSSVSDSLLGLSMIDVTVFL